MRTGTLGIISTLYSRLEPKFSGGLSSPLYCFHSYITENEFRYEKRTNMKQKKRDIFHAFIKNLYQRRVTCVRLRDVEAPP